MGYEYKVVESIEFKNQFGEIDFDKLQKTLIMNGKQGWRFVQTISEGGYTTALVFEK